MGVKEGGGAKGKGTSKEWNKQQAKATQALKAEYFDIYMKKMLELKQAAGASWSKPGVTQQAQVDMESYYFCANQTRGHHQGTHCPLDPYPPPSVCVMHPPAS